MVDVGWPQPLPQLTVASARGSVMLPRGHSPSCAGATDVSTALAGSAPADGWG